jgi:hypothetical protein
VESVGREEEPCAGVTPDGLGKAISRGPLSVPLSWSSASPRSEPAPSATDRKLNGQSSPRGRTFQQGLMAMISGRGAVAKAVRAADADKNGDHDATAPGDAPVAVTRVLTGQTATIAPGSTITLGKDSTIRVNSGSVTVAGGGSGTGARIANAPVTIGVGSTVNTLGRCLAGGIVLPANFQFTMTDGPVTLTQYRRVKVEIELVSGSATTGNSSQQGEITTHAGQSATATVGAEGASITNTKGAVAVITGQHPQLV